jgi:hypothetical protein
MAYGTGVLVKKPDSNFELDEEALVEVTDGQAIIDSAELIFAFQDYTTLSAGTYGGYVSVKINHPNYTIKAGGLTNGDLTVEGQPLTNDTEGVVIEIDDSNCVYNGSIQMPYITSVQYKNVNLTYDPKVKYAEGDTCINAGYKTAYFTITLTGNYIGTLIGYYSIAKLDIADAVYASELFNSEVYTGSSITKTFTYIENGATKSYVSVNEDSPKYLFLNNDFEIFYSNNINVSSAESKASISIAGKGTNVEGTHVINFDILPQGISDSDISDYTLRFNSLVADEYTYNGSAITPEVTYLYSETKGISFNVDPTAYRYVYES